MSEENNWTVREVIGTTVFKYNAADHPDHLDTSKLVPLTQEQDLATGDSILVPAPSGGYYFMIVQANEDGGLIAVNDKLMALLDFGKDDRKAWVCSGIVNLRGLEKFRITS
jgi:hypothetical protein